MADTRRRKKSQETVANRISTPHLQVHHPLLAIPFRSILILISKPRSLQLVLENTHLPVVLITLASPSSSAGGCSEKFRKN